MCTSFPIANFPLCWEPSSLGKLGLLGRRQGVNVCFSSTSLLPLITRNYLKQGFIERRSEEITSHVPGDFMASVPVGSGAKVGEVGK